MISSARSTVGSVDTSRVRITEGNVARCAASKVPKSVSDDTITAASLRARSTGCRRCLRSPSIDHRRTQHHGRRLREVGRCDARRSCRPGTSRRVAQRQGARRARSHRSSRSCAVSASHRCRRGRPCSALHGRAHGRRAAAPVPLSAAQCRSVCRQDVANR